MAHHRSSRRVQWDTCTAAPRTTRSHASSGREEHRRGHMYAPDDWRGYSPPPVAYRRRTVDFEERSYSPLTCSDQSSWDSSRDTYSGSQSYTPRSDNERRGHTSHYSDERSHSPSEYYSQHRGHNDRHYSPPPADRRSRYVKRARSYSPRIPDNAFSYRDISPPAHRDHFRAAAPSHSRGHTPSTRSARGRLSPARASPNTLPVEILKLTSAFLPVLKTFPDEMQRLREHNNQLKKANATLNRKNAKLLAELRTLRSEREACRANHRAVAPRTCTGDSLAPSTVAARSVSPSEPHPRW